MSYHGVKMTQFIYISSITEPEAFLYSPVVHVLLAVPVGLALPAKKC